MVYFCCCRCFYVLDCGYVDRRGVGDEMSIGYKNNDSNKNVLYR